MKKESKTIKDEAAEAVKEWEWKERKKKKNKQKKQ